jgi:hypothetical protein
MKNVLFLLLFLCGSALFAQVKGDGNIVTRNLKMANLETLIVGLYAEVTVDMAAAPGLTVTTDENLLPLLNLKVTDGKLDLQQLEWIKASQPIVITIGAPGLLRVDNTVHVTTEVRNISGSSFLATAFLGRLNLSGEVEEARLAGESGKIDARQLKASFINLNLWDDGKILLGQPDKITGIVKNGGKVIYENGTPQVSISGGGKVIARSEVGQALRPDARFIKFSVKNNSGRRIQCYVSGPKPDGSRFSYGFPLNPGQVRDKDWSVGSKVFIITKLGVRKLLRKITAEDEGEIVRLFAK